MAFCISACGEIDYHNTSLLSLCGQKDNRKVCDMTHSGAMCSKQRSEAIRYMLIYKDDPISYTAYESLKRWTDYE
jgi:hypothetical protein